jgi:hypothetical protein
VQHPNELVQWLEDHFKIVAIRFPEVALQCPRCGHTAFYFNVKKRVGWCHRASCGWAPTLDELESYAPAAYLGPEDNDDEVLPKAQALEPVRLPSGSRPIVSEIKPNGAYIEDMHAFDYLQSRGIGYMEAWEAKLHSTLDRIVVPVFERGALLSWVGRHFRGMAHPVRWTGPKGARHNETLYRWDVFQHVKELTLVENTLVSLSLGVAASFGSHLTDPQIQKIITGSAKSVVLLWDEGAEERAEKAVRRLRAGGVPAGYVRISGQPDDHPKSEMQQTVRTAHEQVREGAVVVVAFTVAKSAVTGP